MFNLSSGNGDLTQDAPLISFTALQRARRTIADFVKTYYPLHGLTSEDFLDHWDLLVFVEASICQLDEWNEQIAGGSMPQEGGEKIENGMKLIEQILRQKGLLSDALAKEIQNGMKFWEHERNFGVIMKAHGNIPKSDHLPPLFTIEEIHAASEKKSFDYRILHLLLYGLRNTQPDQHLMDFLFVDELLVDIGDDLADYEDDICNNSFNVYRLYTHVYGSEAPLRLAERISALETKHDELLSKLPQDIQQFYEKRKLDAAEGPGSLRWTLPQPIRDENSFRTTFYKI